MLSKPTWLLGKTLDICCALIVAAIAICVLLVYMPRLAGYRQSSRRSGREVESMVGGRCKMCDGGVGGGCERESAVGGQGQGRGKGKLRTHTPPAAPSFLRASWRRGIEDDQLDSIPSSLQFDHFFRANGSNTESILLLPLRLPPHRARTALPSITTAHHKATASPPAPSSIGLTTSRRAPPNPFTALRPLGWNPQRRAQEEDIAHEEAAPADGRGEAFEGCHSAEQVQCVWAGQEGACALSLLCAE